MAETKRNVAAPTDVQSLIVAFKKRGAKAKGNIRKTPATPVSSQSDDSSDYSSSENKSGHRIKRRKKDTAPLDLEPIDLDALSANNE